MAPYFCNRNAHSQWVDTVQHITLDYYYDNTSNHKIDASNWLTTDQTSQVVQLWTNLNAQITTSGGLIAVPNPPVPHAPAVPPLGFNRYVNGSDLLEEFIAFLGEQGVRQGDVMGLPIDLFIRWMIIRACEEDQEEPNVTLELPARPQQPRCLGCQKFMCREIPIPLHDERCAQRYFARTALSEAA